jgi:hypothetical protein
VSELEISLEGKKVASPFPHSHFEVEVGAFEAKLKDPACLRPQLKFSVHTGNRSCTFF